MRSASTATCTTLTAQAPHQRCLRAQAAPLLASAAAMHLALCNARQCWSIWRWRDERGNPGNLSGNSKMETRVLGSLESFYSP